MGWKRKDYMHSYIEQRPGACPWSSRPSAGDMPHTCLAEICLNLLPEMSGTCRMRILVRLLGNTNTRHSTQKGFDTPQRKLSNNSVCFQKVQAERRPAKPFQWGEGMGCGQGTFSPNFFCSYTSHLSPNNSPLSHHACVCMISEGA